MHDHNSATVLLTLILSSILSAYIGAVTYQQKNGPQKNGRRWKKRRVAWFFLGILILAIAFLSPLEEQAHHHFDAHMVQHLLIGMFAPIALVLSAPVSLLLRSIPIGAANRLTQVLHSRLFYWLSHPSITLLLNIGGMYLLYLTPLYVLSLNHSVIHYLIHWHFLVAGYLFVWSIIGPDPAPGRPGFQYRAIVLFISIAAHAILAKLIYGQLFPSGAGYPANDIRHAAKIMYYGGDLAELIVAVILFHQMDRKESLTRNSPKIRQSFHKIS